MCGGGGVILGGGLASERSMPPPFSGVHVDPRGSALFRALEDVTRAYTAQTHRRTSCTERTRHGSFLFVESLRFAVWVHENGKAVLSRGDGRGGERESDTGRRAYERYSRPRQDTVPTPGTGDNNNSKGGNKEEQQRKQETGCQRTPYARTHRHRHRHRYLHHPTVNSEERRTATKDAHRERKAKTRNGTASPRRHRYNHHNTGTTKAYWRSLM